MIFWPTTGPSLGPRYCLIRLGTRLGQLSAPAYLNNDFSACGFNFAWSKVWLHQVLAHTIFLQGAQSTFVLGSTSKTTTRVDAWPESWSKNRVSLVTHRGTTQGHSCLKQMYPNPTTTRMCNSSCSRCREQVILRFFSSSWVIPKKSRWLLKAAVYSNVRQFSIK